MSNKKITGLAIGALLLALSYHAEGQQPTKISRVGYLNAGSASTNPARIEAFRQGLRELGYVEGKNIVIEYRAAEGKLDRLPALAAELVSRLTLLLQTVRQRLRLPRTQLARSPSS